jgi:hypothetical protein
MFFPMNNGISPEITKIPMMNQFDMAYSMGGQYWMILYWPVIFINFLLVMKLIEYGLLNNCDYDLIFLGVVVLIFIVPFCTLTLIWYLHNVIGVI